MTPRAGVILLAAGSGRRFGSRIPKQFLPLAGEALFLRSLRTFASVPAVKQIVIVTEPKNEKRMRRSIPSALAKKIRLAPGGAFRGASVRNGFQELDGTLDVVLVHDSARPLVTSSAVKRVIRAAFKSGAALAAWPLPDTLKKADAQGRVKRTIPRRNLWIAQTPQGFRMSVAKKCLTRPSATATDDAELAERRGFPVRVVPGTATNFKVTFREDLILCNAVLKKAR